MGISVLASSSLWCWSLVWFLAAPTPAQQAQEMKQLYIQSMASVKQKKWVQASQQLQRLLPLFRQVQARRKAGSQAYHLMTIGRADVLYHLAVATWKRNLKRASCLHHKAIADAIATLPPPWRSWSVRPELPRRFQASARQLSGPCRVVPSVVNLTIAAPAPKGLTIAIQSAAGTWRTLSKRRLEVRQLSISLKATAPGFLPVTITQRFVPRWKVSAIEINLTPKPKARVVVIKQRVPPRLPPTPLPGMPFYNTWWFWTITGTAVVGVSTGVILYFALPRNYEFRSDNQPGFRIAK